MIRKYKLPILFFLLFETIAVVLWLVLDNRFYLFNFSYIGMALAIGLALFTAGYKQARMVVQLAVGLYMLVYLGIVCRENMQIEGLWYYLSTGVFQAATIHYVVAKIFGPLLFGRGWCGYACWTAMVLDSLPYKTAQHSRKAKLGWLRVGTFSVSLIFMLCLLKFYTGDIERAMFIAFVAGNALYYLLGITLALVLKDNRAFCKYLCPITVFLKPFSYFSLVRIKVDAEKCVSCGKCKRGCPMEVDMLDSSRSRKNGTECILCNNCVRECPTQAIGRR